MTLDELKQKLAKIPANGAMNKAKRAKIIAEINRKAGEKDANSRKG